MVDVHPIDIQGLTVHYGRKVALDAVSLHVPRGSVTALLGRNGAGKSSLIHCLLGQRRPQAGRTTLFGEPSFERRAALMSRVGVVPEDPDAPPSMTPRQLATFSAPLYAEWDATTFAERLARFDVPEDLPFGRLSKGQKAQVMLALALAPHPDLLVLDDPTLGLDAAARKTVFEELVDELAERQTTVLMTTHDLAGVEGMADRVGILKEGRLVLFEEMETLKTRFRRLRFPREAGDAAALAPTLAPFRPSRVARSLGAVEAVVTAYDEDAVLGGATKPEITPLSLEEIFLAVTEKEALS